MGMAAMRSLWASMSGDMRDQLEQLLGAAGKPAALAAAVEFVLEGLHLNRKLNKERGESRFTYHS